MSNQLTCDEYFDHCLTHDPLPRQEVRDLLTELETMHVDYR